MVETDY